MCTVRWRYPVLFQNTRATNEASLPFLHKIICHGNVLDKLENKVHHLHLKSYHTVKRLQKSVQYIRIYSTKYASLLAVSYLTFSNELHYLLSYPAEGHQIFARYSHIISAVNAHI